MRTRAVHTPTCSLGVCTTVDTTETDAAGCARVTEGTACELGAPICGVEPACRVCRSGRCEVNSPAYDAACLPTCRQLGTLCDAGGFAVNCAGVGCPAGVPVRSASDTPVCCVGRCCAGGICI
jgi:hypothetical protein